MHFLILGNLKVENLGKRISITAPKQRAVLAALLLQANNEVQIERLIRFVWDGRPPVTAQTTLQSYIYRLRQLLRPLAGVELKTSTDSYMLSVDYAETDLWYFRQQVDTARAMARSDDKADAARIPDWGDPGHSVRVHGRPSITLTTDDEWVSDEVSAAAAHALNSVPVVCAAEPGIRTNLDLPPVTGRMEAAVPGGL